MDKGEDARVLLNGVIYTVSVPYDTHKQKTTNKELTVRTVLQDPECPSAVSFSQHCKHSFVLPLLPASVPSHALLLPALLSGLPNVLLPEYNTQFRGLTPRTITVHECCKAKQRLVKLGKLLLCFSINSRFITKLKSIQ